MSATLETKVIPNNDGKYSEYIYQKSSYLGKFSELIRFIVNLANTKQKNTKQYSVFICFYLLFTLPTEIYQPKLQTGSRIRY